MENVLRENMKELFRQFCEAYGIKNVNYEDSTLITAFFEWMKEEKKDNDKFYLSQLKKLGINIKTNHTIEVGKNECDSLVVPYDTVIAPKFSEGFEDLGKRVIVSNLKFHGNLPFLIQKGVHVDHSIPCDVYNTFMTQNPYSFDEIAEWNKLPYAYHDIVVGVYGDVNDADRAIKQNMMYQFMEKINPQVLPELHIIDNEDKYATIVTANRKR